LTSAPPASARAALAIAEVFLAKARAQTGRRTLAHDALVENYPAALGMVQPIFRRRMELYCYCYCCCGGGRSGSPRPSGAPLDLRTGIPIIRRNALNARISRRGQDLVIYLENRVQRRRGGRMRSSGVNQTRRAIIMALIFLLVVLMALTSLGVFGESVADAVRHLIRG